MIMWGMQYEEGHCPSWGAHLLFRCADPGIRRGVLANTATTKWCSEFGCGRLFSTNPMVCYVMDTWRISCGVFRHPSSATHFTKPSLTEHCPRLRRSDSRSIWKPKRTQRPVRVTAAHSGLWICGPWCGDPNGWHHVHYMVVCDYACHRAPFAWHCSASYLRCVRMAKEKFAWHCSASCMRCVWIAREREGALGDLSEYFLCDV